MKLKFGTGTQNWMLIHTAGSKSGFKDDFGQYAAKTIILRPFLAFFSAKRLLEMTLPWQHLRSQAIKNYLEECVIYKN